jgi:cob(I)alamin adenosyltransferase
MPTYFTRTGDDGKTGLLGEGRVAKDSPIIEAVGTVDEASAALGMARAACQVTANLELLLTVQRDLYHLMAELAATPENASRFHKIDAQSVSWLESQINDLGSTVEMPGDFILPGDSQAGAALALARTIVRRAERRVARLLNAGSLQNIELHHYLNRLSSLCFVMELVENQAAGKGKPTLAKDQ